VGNALSSFFGHPITLGALLGGVGGAGLGYISPDDPELRGSGALAGGVAGGLLGAGIGGLSIPPVVKKNIIRQQIVQKSPLGAAEKLRAILEDVAEHEGPITAEQLKRLGPRMQHIL